jgi:hypothetical protein
MSPKSAKADLGGFPIGNATNIVSRALSGHDPYNIRVSLIGKRSRLAAQEGDPMAFKPNYGRDRAERQRAARARKEEKQRKKDEKVELRKAEREAAEAPPDDKQADG